MALTSGFKEFSAELISVLTYFIASLTTANILPVAFLVERGMKA